MDGRDSLSAEEPQGRGVSDLECPHRQCYVGGIDRLEARINTSGRSYTRSSKGRLGHGMVLVLAVERCETQHDRANR